jgi:acyl transferase domain-containing protein
MAMNPIAIIGVSCRFPKANNLEEFWQLLHHGTDGITEVPKSRWDVDSLYSPELGEKGKMNTRWGGFIAEVDKFDTEFFQISPREAENMDPQQRLLMEVAWEALENSSIIPENLAGSQTGVFIGISSYDYGRLINNDLLNLSPYSGVGTSLSIAANRLSYFFDLKGPSLSVDTACSSSLVALHYACQSLALGESNLALVGGVNLILSPIPTVIFSQARMMAADGRCKTFDAKADGYVRGEGCGVVVLKRLEDALKDGDNVWAVIRGSAINQDGLTNGITAPNGPSQQAVIRQALKNAAVRAEEISYIEAHGTGTALGDPIEVKSLKAIFGQGRSPEETCWLGSVKTNIGHLESAAGIASLIKVVLALQHRQIPAHLHFQTLNPHISLEGTALKIPTTLENWSIPRRLAGISSFGFGGTNCHVIVEEAPEKPNLTDKQYLLEQRSWQIITLSAKTQPALKVLAQSYQDYLLRDKEASLADLCFSANTTRSHFEHRLVVVTSSKKQLQEQLENFIRDKEAWNWHQGVVKRTRNTKIAFLFTGQGSQYIRMGQQLYKTSSTVRDILNECEQILATHLERPLLTVMFEEGSLLNQTAYTQPALFTLEYALAKLWQSWGIQPSLLMGHSLGEYVAACLAGVFSLAEGLTLVAKRGQLIGALPQNGSMLSVSASENYLQDILGEDGVGWNIAAINGENSTVVSGLIGVLEAIKIKLEAKGIKTKYLEVSHPFHSYLIEPILEEFKQFAELISYRSPQLPIVANLTGQVIGEEMAKAEYWCRHLVEPVRFLQSMETIAQTGHKIFLELGPNSILSGMGYKCLPDLEALWLPSLRTTRSDWEQILESLSKLDIADVNINWQEVFRDFPRQKLTLPNYPFQRQSYWLSEQTAKSLITSPREDRKEQEIAKVKNWFYDIQWRKVDPLVPLSKRSSSGIWLVFSCQTQDLGKSLKEELAKQGKTCILVVQGEEYLEFQEQQIFQVNSNNPGDLTRFWQSLDPKCIQDLEGVIHLWSLDSVATHELTPALLERSQILGCASVVKLLQLVAASQGQSSPKIWLITRGAVKVSSPVVSLAQSAVWGLGKVIALEYPELWGGLIDLDPFGNSQEITTIVNQIMASSPEKQIALRQESVYVPRLVPASIPLTSKIAFSQDGTYLITGGLGALGLKIAAWLLEKGAKNLALVARKAPTPEVRDYLAKLENSHQSKIAVVSADVANYQELQSALDTIKKTMPPLRGIFHTAGVLGWQSLKNLDWESFSQVLNPKTVGTWLLHQLTEQENLDLFVCFSSIASAWGSKEQAHYAAANFFQDQFAFYRQSLGLPATTINWGPWEEGGMASQEAKHILGKMGISTLEPSQAFLCLTSILQAQLVHAIVVELDRQLFQDVYQFRGTNPFLSELHELEESRDSQPENILETWKNLAQEERKNWLESYLLSWLATSLGKNAQDIDIYSPLISMGFDSLMAMEFRNKVKANLGIEIPMAKLMQDASLNQLSIELSEQLQTSVEQVDNEKNNYIEGEI